MLACAGLLLAAPLADAGPAGGPLRTERSLTQSAHDTAVTVWSGAQDLAVYALGLIGVDYRFGGTSPERGLDCSGLVRYVFQQVTGVTLPRTARELSRLGTRIAADKLQPGDLLFFNTRELAFSHVGIYLGDDRFIHAPSSGGEVEIVTLSGGYWHKHFNGARRLVGVLPDLIPNASAQAVQSIAPPAEPAAAELGADSIPFSGPQGRAGESGA